MPLANDLLDVARVLRDSHPEEEHQASLRRAVSTAYYALFHLLVSEAAANWARPELRAPLGRCFDHGPMNSASVTLTSQITAARKGNLSAESATLDSLYQVADAFIQAQYNRNEADYNVAREWTVADVSEQIDLVAEAFQAWNQVRNEPSAQAYLLSLLGTKERRPPKQKPPDNSMKSQRSKI